jgi:cytochrome b subunit of formate dehydrogenase
MHFIQWAISPWGQDIPVHIAWGLIWVAAIAGFTFLVVHAIWIRYFAKAEEFEGASVSAGAAAGLPSEVKRHSLAARLFHWVMAASMLVLLVTAFLPKIGVEFPWVTYHWIAGLVLIASILFHLVHATFYMDFWSIWPDRTDLLDAKNRTLRFFGKPAPRPHRFAKYPFENKLYHLAIVFAGLAVACTGAFMIFRVRTPFLTRNPYLFGDMTWGMMYVLHGLAGVGLITLITIHIYFALRPEKLVITKSMITGSMNRDYVLQHHDPTRWKVLPGSPSREGSAAD